MDQQCGDCRIQQVRQRRNGKLLEEPELQKLIDDLMREFYTIFSRVDTVHRSCAGSHGSSSQSLSQLALASKDGSSTQATSIRCQIGDSEENLEEDEGDHLPKRPKLLQKPSDDTVPGSKFACPFHQQNPRKYGVNLQSRDVVYRSCAGLGWKSVARIK